MNGIAVSPAMLILKGIPEGFIIAWGIHILTDTKPDWKRYLLLSGMYILITYLIRFLPITLGINTVLSPFVLIFSYQLVYRADLNKMIRAMIASIIILVCNALSEVFNMALLSAVFGSEKADVLAWNTEKFSDAIYSLPSTILMALITLAGYFILKKMRQNDNARKRVNEDGKTGQETRR